MSNSNLTDEDLVNRKKIIRDIRNKIGLSNRGLDYFLSLGIEDGKMRGNITYRKELPLDIKNSQAPSKMHMLSLGLLEILYDEGYDLESISFDEGKHIMNPTIKKR
jgi:hypothetical protein